MPSSDAGSKSVAITVAVVGAVLCMLAAVLPTDHPVGGTEASSADIAWMLTASGLVLLMTPGLSYFYGGLVDRRNLISTMLQSIVALGVVSLLWYVVGFSLAFGDSLGGLIGNPLSFPFFHNVGTTAHPRLGVGLPFVLFAAFQLKFAIITPALITGSFAERVRFRAYLLFIVLFTLLIYCPLAHMTWHPDGLLARIGILDFAGGTVVHISAGVAAWAGAMYLGPRVRHRRNEVHATPNVPYVILGTGLLWFGWFGFNAGSALSANLVAVNAFINTNIASASAMVWWMLIDTLRGGRPSATGACVGAVVGLVAITPAAGFVTIGPSVAIGALAALVSNMAVHWKSTTDVDDTLDVFPCHGVGGMVGMLMTAVFATQGGLIAGHTDLLVKHIVALVGVAVSVFVASLALYRVTDRIVPLRVSPEDERIGLDISQHNEHVPVLDHV